MRMKLQGLQEIKSALVKLPIEVRAAADKALAEAASNIADDVVRSIQTGKRTGLMYGSHQASAPGEPPANKTGNLANSVSTVRLGATSHFVKVAAYYSGFLESGTYKMAPRPFIEPAIERGAKMVKRLTKAAVQKAIARLAKKTKGRKRTRRK